MRSTAEICFDLRHGLSAFLPQEPTSEADANFRLDDAIQYQGVDPRLLQKILATLPPQAFQFPFIDYGCGKGRGLAVGALAGFRSVIGVEVSAGLAARAEANLRTLSRRINGLQVTVQCMDATLFQLPPSPLVVFLYNPFIGPTLKRIAAILKTQTDSAPLWIIYVNPLGLEEFLNCGFRIKQSWLHKNSLEAVLLES